MTGKARASRSVAEARSPAGSPRRVEGQPTSTASSLLELQRTAGNRGVTQLVGGHHRESGPVVLQRRMAGSSAALQQAGMQTRLVGRILGSVWDDLVTAVGEYEMTESKAIGKKYLRPSEKTALLSRLDSMERMAQKWLNDPSHRRRYERNVDLAEAAGLDEATKRDIKRAGLLKLLLPRIRLERLDVQSGRVLEGGSFSDAALAGASQDQAVGDATKKLDIVSHRVDGREQQGFFAHDEYGPHRGLENALFQGGADRMAPNLGARAVAMSRLAELLRAPIVAKTDFGTHTSETVVVDDTKTETRLPSQAKMGFRQANARGANKVLSDQGGRLAEAGRLVGTTAQRAAGAGTGQPKVAIDDPELQKALSALQVIDAIAGQLDRHTNNYFIHMDSSGRVNGLTGIDLDMAFAPEHTEIDPQTAHKGEGKLGGKFRGVPALVDAGFAEDVIGLDPREVRKLVDALLSPEEASATMGRLGQVQNALRRMKDERKLVENWDTQTAREQVKAGSSYLTDLRMQPFMNFMERIGDWKSSAPGAGEVPISTWNRVWDSVMEPAIREHLEFQLPQMVTILTEAARQLEEHPDAKTTRQRVEAIQNNQRVEGPRKSALNLAYGDQKRNWANLLCQLFLEQYRAAGFTEAQLRPPVALEPVPEDKFPPGT